MNIVDNDDTISFTRHIYSPDPIVRFQYEHVHGGQKGSAEDQAVRSLMLALFADAIASYKKYFFKPSRTNKIHFREAEEWINANDDGVFSFSNVCETLGLQPGYLRKRLERWSAKETEARLEKRRLRIIKGNARKRKNTAHARPPRLRKSNNGSYEPFETNHRREAYSNHKRRGLGADGQSE